VPALADMNGASASEEARLASEIAWLKQQIPTLSTSLSQLQQQHAALTAQAAAQPQPEPASYGGAPPHPMQQQYTPQPEVAGPARQPAPSPQASVWTEHTNPENGQAYWWNYVTGESTYTRPDGFQPANSGSATAVGLPQTKGPPGANLFVVRKMRRGEYDAFNAEDLRREFSRYGPVTRADITMDKETGWSKGFGFVSFANVESADAAVAAIHGSWVDGCVADGVRTERALVGCSRGRLVLSCRGWGAGAE